MRPWSVAIAVFLLFGVARSALADDILFSDNFDRPNSSSVGNGWLNLSGYSNGSLVIENGALTTLGTPLSDGIAGIYRPIDFANGVRVQGTLTQQNGFAGLANRYVSGFSIFNDGALYTKDIPNGLSVMFYRGDQNFSNSAVRLYVDGVVADIQPSSFQFGASIDFDVNYAQKTFIGTVSSGSNSFHFQFATPTVPANGANLAVWLGVPNPLFINPTLDSLVVSSADPSITPIPEPSTLSLLGAGLLALLSFRAICGLKDKDKRFNDTSGVAPSLQV